MSSSLSSSSPSSSSMALKSQMRLLYALIPLIFLSHIKVSAAQTDTCGSDLTTFLPAPYNDSSSQICKPVWNGFILRYSQSKDNVLTVVLSAVYTAGWVGMGFSKNGMMVGSSAMVGWIGKDDKARIKQYFLSGTSPSEILVDQGELQSTGVGHVVVLHGATIYLAFQLKFSASVTHQPLIFAVGVNPPKHYQLTPHEDKQTMMFDFSSGADISSGSFNPSQLKQTHGILAIFGWGVLLPIGAIVARYFRQLDPLWFYLHTVIQFVGFIIGLAAIVAGSVLYNKLHSNVAVHRAIGIFVFSLSILQIIAFFLRPNKDAKVRKYWNWYHHWVGRLSLFLAAVNIVLGIQLGGAGSSWKISYAFNLAVILIAVFVLETLLCIRGSKKKADIPALQMNSI